MYCKKASISVEVVTNWSFNNAREVLGHAYEDAARASTKYLWINIRKVTCEFFGPAPWLRQTKECC